MRIAICQIDPIIGHFIYNTSLILDGVEKAKASGCSLAIFPEMSIIGYPPKDLLERPAFLRENLDQLNRLASRIEGIHVLCGYVDRNPLEVGKPLVNSVALIGGGRVLKKGGKRLLPAYDVFDETRYFEPAHESLVFDLGGRRFGVTICEDIWTVGDIKGLPHYAFNPVAELHSQSIDVLVNISASPYTLNKAPLRMRILQSLSLEYKIPTVYCNQVGGNDDLLFDGMSMVVDSRGRLILLGEEFAPDLLVWDTNSTCDEIDQPWPEEEESVLRGLIVGTRDYVTKCGFKKVLVGLSGGIDSSLVAVIAQRALGPENVMCLSMPSPFTSEMSNEDARTLARNLGVRHEFIPIHDIFEAYKLALEPLFRGLKEDETEENIQARIRGNLLMALSNKFNALLLTTGNKSEFAMGYCTLYGDLSGGLAVISDIPKTMCYRLARYINTDSEIIPHRVLTRPPSAELRPDQKDQDSLPSYEILDGILEAAIEENLGLEEIVARGYDPETVRDVLKRLALNEYKRRQAPPGLKITTKAFGYGRRYPIARGPEPY
ncbi:MAG: NAD+ synthase [Deltaproteobacteria bacterium]|nr:NAD+ synthase [Deltaproteobacteria bacterium]MBW2135923.1 NAD+ synthase [Deltaproteobacteria bacterium]